MQLNSSNPVSPTYPVSHRSLSLIATTEPFFSCCSVAKQRRLKETAPLRKQHLALQTIATEAVWLSILDLVSDHFLVDNIYVLLYYIYLYVESSTCVQKCRESFTIWKIYTKKQRSAFLILIQGRHLGLPKNIVQRLIRENVTNSFETVFKKISSIDGVEDNIFWLLCLFSLWCVTAKIKLWNCSLCTKLD